MRYFPVIKVLGMLLMIFSLSMLPPIAVSYYYHDSSEFAFFTAYLLTFLSGFLLWLACRESRHELKLRDGFLVVVLFWTVLSLFASIPIVLDFFPKLAFVDAVFESVSGLTTTGATILTHVEQLPHGILYYRQQLHLLGGMGIIVLAVAILPMLGIGGMQLYRAETVGPIKNTKLRPRMAETAKALWYIYASLVIVCALSYWASGMTLFDAIGESFSTLSTGGFSTHDTSFAYYHSHTKELIAVLFMFAGATNFSLHFNAIRKKSMGAYIKDTECRAYLTLLGVTTLVAVVILLIKTHSQVFDTVVHTLFTVVSLSSTTGFTTVNFSAWPLFLPCLMMFIALIGGCGGSTSGGIKVMRCLLLKAQGERELVQLIHPEAVTSIKLGKDILPESVVQSIWAFVSVFIVLFILLFLGLLGTGLDITTAFGALASCISNTGAAIGSVSGNFSHLPSMSKWLLIISMLAGRLEIFTLLVLFTPRYWRK